MAFTILNEVPDQTPGDDKPGEDFLRIDATKKNVKAKLYTLRFKDADTGHFVAYIPTLEISGYGETQEQAMEMLKFSMDEFFKYVTSIKASQLLTELSKLEWKRNYFRSKKFSKVQVDESGGLQNFNVVDNSVVRLTLVS